MIGFTQDEQRDDEQTEANPTFPRRGHSPQASQGPLQEGYGHLGNGAGT